MEFKQKTDLATLPQEIDFNFKELESELSDQLEQYRGITVTEETIPPAKKCRANLNKLKGALDTERKRIKTEYQKPLVAFESKVKILINMVDEVSGEIDTQIKEFENAKKEQKQKEIEDYFKSNVGDLKELLPFNRIYDDRWLNATYKVADIQNEIDASIEQTAKDLRIISSLDAEFELQVKDVYLRTLNLSEALAEKTRLEERKKQMEEYAKQEQEDVRNDTNPEQPEEAIAEEPKAIAEETKDIKVAFYETTAAFRHEIKALTEKHGIRYGWA